MAQPLGNLVLYCDSERQKYTLRFEDAPDSDSFSSTEEAMVFAATLVNRETKLTVYDASGKPLIITSVLPA
jgi:hypothetical protein